MKDTAATRKEKAYPHSVPRQAAYLALSVALLTVCAWITIPFSVIPVTLQTFAVALIGALLGAVRGCIAVAIYLVMGLCGIPVFSGFRAGVPALLGPTGGYMIGFLFEALLAGLFMKIPVKNQAGKAATLYAGMIIGLFICYFFGTLWFLTVYNRSGADPVGVGVALMLCVVPYLAPDCIKLFVAALLGARLGRYVRI